MDFLKEINWQLVVMQILCFFTVLAVLRWKLWTPTFQLLEDRRDKIAAELKTIEDAKVELSRIKAEYSSHLARIDQEAQARMKDVERQGEERAREIREQARLDSEQIIVDARKEIQFELAKTKAALKNDVVEMVIKATEQVIHEKMTFEKDRMLVEGILTEMVQADEK